MPQARLKYGAGYTYWYSKDGQTYVEGCREMKLGPDEKFNDQDIADICWDHVVLGRSAGFSSQMTKPIMKASELQQAGAEFF